jgi:hypothetical protein
MNSFEEYTVIIGVLAIALEGFSYVRDFLHKLFHHS